MEEENRKRLIDGAKTFGVLLEKRNVEAFDRYLRELLKWNQRINLTAIRTEDEIVLKHFIDSLSVFPYLPRGISVLDAGSGPGFPGIPLKIVEPSLQVTLIDSVRKKIDFQKHIIRTLGLTGIDTFHGRMEEREVTDRFKKGFDAVVSRAFSDLRTFLELSVPLLKEGGMVIAMKGPLTENEIEQIREGVKAPFHLIDTARFFLPSSSIRRSILMFRVVEGGPDQGLLQSAGRCGPE